MPVRIKKYLASRWTIAPDRRRSAENSRRIRSKSASVSDALCPAAIVTGRLGAVNEKYFVDTDALLMLADVFPVLLTESVSTLLLPAATLPKFNACAPNDKLPVAVGVGLVELDDLELNP